MTDLTPICFGFGPLMSESALYDKTWSDGAFHFQQMSKVGYLNALEFGFGMAMFASLRDGDESWTRELRPDSKATLDATLRYWSQLNRSGIEPLFKATDIPGVNASPARLKSWLTGKEPGYVLAALWQLHGMVRSIEPWIDVIAKLARARDVDIAASAVRLLSLGKTEAVSASIIRAMRDGRTRVAVAAVSSASVLEIDLAKHATILEGLLNDCQHDPFELLKIIEDQGEQLQDLSGPIIGWLVRAHHAIEDDKAHALMSCLKRIHPDPQREINQRVQEPETRRELSQRLIAGY